MPTVRKIVMLREQVFDELGEAAASRPVTRVAALAVIANPFAGRFVANLEPLWLIGAKLGEHAHAGAGGAAGRAAPSPTARARSSACTARWSTAAPASIRCSGGRCATAIGGGKAVIPSNVKVAAAGAALDLPLGHKDDPWSFAHFDTMTVTVADAPRPDEIVVALALADGGRLNNRCGERPVTR